MWMRRKKWAFFLGGQMFRRRAQVMTTTAFPLEPNCFGALGLLLGQAALHEVLGVLAQLGDLGRADDVGDDQVAERLEEHVLLDRHLVAIGVGRGRRRGRPRACVVEATMDGNLL